MSVDFNFEVPGYSPSTSFNFTYGTFLDFGDVEYTPPSGNKVNLNLFEYTPPVEGNFVFTGPAYTPPSEGDVIFGVDPVTGWPGKLLGISIAKIMGLEVSNVF